MGSDGRGACRRRKTAKTAASVSATVLHSISGCHDNCCHDSFAATKQHTHTHRGLLWGFSAPVRWSRWRWVLGLPCCRSSSGAATPPPAPWTRQSPAEQTAAGLVRVGSWLASTAETRWHRRQGSSWPGCSCERMWGFWLPRKPTAALGRVSHSLSELV